MDQQLRKVIEECLQPGANIKAAAKRISRTARQRGWTALGMAPCGLNQAELIREILKVQRRKVN